MTTETAQNDNAALPFALVDATTTDSGALAFAFAPDGFIDSGALPLPLSIAETTASDSGALALALDGNSDNNGGNNGSGGTPDASVRTGRCLLGDTPPTLTVADGVTDAFRAVPVSRYWGMDYGVTISFTQCHRHETAFLPAVANCTNGAAVPTVAVADCHFGRFADVEALANCSVSVYPTTPVESGRIIAVLNCLYGDLSAPVNLNNCTASDTPAVTALLNCAVDKGLTLALSHCFSSDTVPTVPVPCEWYKIEVPDVEPPYNPPCGAPPDSDELPLSFVRRESQNEDSDMLPLHFVCHVKTEPNLRKTYMIYNTVTAEIDGQSIGIYTADISTSMDSFCWQFNVEIRHDDFAKFNLENRSDDPLLMLTINGHQWLMLVEDYSERKAFNRDSYTLTGRSRTALLTGDYADRETQLITATLNASQLAQQQLAGTGFSLVYDSDADWLVPANTYTVSGTPIDVIMDIADAGGHYVESHPTDATLYIRKRYPRPAWEINANTADRVISNLTWLSLSANRRISTQYNAVRLVGNAGNAVGGYIMRSSQSGNPYPEASTLTHALYAGDSNSSPINAWRNKGIQVLSDSGKHKLYDVEQLWANDTTNPENIALAQLGEVLEITDAGSQTPALGKGVVTDVAIKVGEDNEATEIIQSYGVNSYLGD